MKTTPKISLCLIVGNVEEYIDRCLTSFAPIADEICVVRAIGNATPDRTLDIAREKFGAIVSEYKNAPGHEDWPHVDSFAAARNASFALATGDYCFWCDTDDILESGAELIRQHAERGGYAAYLYPYKILGKGVNILRERLISRGSGKWIYPVHECFDFAIQPIQSVQDDRVIITHLPHLDKSGSNERNLRILKSIPEEQYTAGLLYHMQAELAAAGDHEGSVKAATRALAMPELAKPERFELFLNLANMTQDPAQKETCYLQAYATDPRRAEPLAFLACNCMDYGRNEDALAFARQMRATRQPQKYEWNERPEIYSWLGDEIYGQALRVNGKKNVAEIVRKETMQKAGGPRIALLHATRGRPQQAAIARKTWVHLAEQPDRIEHIFVCDEDDAESFALQRMHHLIIPAGGGCVAAWNHAAFSTEAPVLVQLSDDWLPVPMWDKLILERLGDINEPKVLAISDGSRKDDLLCMAICTRAYFEQDYFLFHPAFTGVYSDNYFTDLAYKRGQVIEARDIVFTHQHPAFIKNIAFDQTYQNQNAPERYAYGSAVYQQLSQGNDWSTVPGFTNYWMLYQNIAAAAKDGDTLVEVGVWMGRSIIFLAQELQRLGKTKCKLYAVDTFVGELNQPAHESIVAAHGGSLRDVFVKNITRCGVADMITVIENDSAEAAECFAPKSVDFCYVDAAHDYESVKRDVAAWLPKVRGTIAGHDAQHEPVMRAVKELIPTAIRIGPCWMQGEIQ